jgi:hypothetical protein
VNRVAFPVIGVMPEHFRGMSVGMAADVWIPLMMQGVANPGSGPERLSRGNSWLTLVGRMKPGLDRNQANAGLQHVERQLAADLSRPEPRTMVLAPGSQEDSYLPGIMFRPLLALLTAA